MTTDRLHGHEPPARDAVARDRADRRPRESDGPPESAESLWVLTVAPTLWALHFLASYLTAAIWCARGAGSAGELGPVRVAILVYTLVALAGIAVVGIVGLRRHRIGSAAVPHDFDTPEDRHRFLGFATLLLAGLSAVATLYVASVALFFESCR